MIPRVKSQYKRGVAPIGYIILATPPHTAYLKSTTTTTCTTKVNVIQAVITGPIKWIA